MQQRWVKTTRNDGGKVPWYLPTLWQAMGIGGWWRLLRAHSFRMSLAKIPLALLLTYTSIVISSAGAIQSMIFGRRLKRTVIKEPPVFVIGHWRSGTTHLHDLLSLDERFAYPSTFECMCPHHCLLTERIFPLLWGWLVPKKRLVDGMSYGFERPQEDEIGMLALGAPTPMWWVAYPEEQSGQPFLSLRSVTERDRDKWQATFQKILRLLTYRHPGKPLVLKSPPHTARVKLLAQMFPNARFVHIVREPTAVFASTVHLWKTLHAISGLVPLREGATESYVLDCMKEMYSTFDSDVAALVPGRFHQIRYEDLIANPQATLQQCYHDLDLGDFERVRPRVAEYVRRLQDYRTNDYELAPAAKDAVRNAWQSIYAKWGYSL